MPKDFHWNKGAKRDFEKTFDEDGQDVFTFALDQLAGGHALLAS